MTRRLALITDDFSSELSRDLAFIIEESCLAVDEVFWLTPSDIHIHHNIPVGLMSQISWDKQANSPQLGDTFLAPLDRMDTIWWYVSPPYTFDHFLALDILMSLTANVQVVNYPPLLKSVYPQLFMLQQSSFIPPTLVTKKIKAVEAFLKEISDDAIIYPLNIPAAPIPISINQKTFDLTSLLKTLTVNETQFVMVQKLLKGEISPPKRIFFVNGELIGAPIPLPSHPLLTSTTSAPQNSSVELVEREGEVVYQLAKIFLKEGIYLASVDLCDGQICNINFTAPNGLYQYYSLTQENIPKNLLEKILKK